MLSTWKQIFTRRAQRLLWIYLHDNFVIETMGDVRVLEANIKCAFVRIDLNNYYRVQEFRQERRVAEYRQKIGNGELGYFAVCNDTMVGSIWATTNHKRVRSVVRMHMPLMPNEALIHDIVTAGSLRGMGVGPFMVGRMASTLLDEYRIKRIIIDVSCRNRPSLRMMEKIGLQSKERVLSVSLFSKLAFRKALKPVSAHACWRRGAGFRKENRQSDEAKWKIRCSDRRTH